MPSEKTVSKCSETRRSTKPIMEKRRRARINNSLSELKNLILDALKKDNARHSKLEKADILEMTVRHLRGLRSQQQHPDPDAAAQFRAGFSECADEVGRFMNREDATDARRRLLGHLARCLAGMTGDRPESTGIRLVPTRLPGGEIAFLLPALYAPAALPVSPASSASSPLSPADVPGLPSPAASPVSSPVSFGPVSVISRCPPAHPHSKAVWRPF